MPVTIQRSVIFFLFFSFFAQRWHRTDKALYIWTAQALLQYATTTQDRENQNGRNYSQNIKCNGRESWWILYYYIYSSVRIKTRIHTEVTLNRICANAQNSGNYETHLKCSQDWSHLGFDLLRALSLVA